MASAAALQASASSRSSLRCCHRGEGGMSGARRDTAITSQPAATNASAAACPTTPEAPAIRTFPTGISACSADHAKPLQRDVDPGAIAGALIDCGKLFGLGVVLGLGRSINSLGLRVGPA